jgi:hypothetical protein
MGATFSSRRRRGLPVLRGRRVLAARRPAPLLLPKSSSPSAVTLTPGTTYTLRIRTGSDGNTLCGTCTGTVVGSCLTHNPPTSTSSSPPLRVASPSPPVTPPSAEARSITLTTNANLIATNYEWYANGTCTGTPFASGPGVNQVDVNPTTTTTYCVRATFTGGCGEYHRYHHCHPPSRPHCLLHHYSRPLLRRPGRHPRPLLLPVCAILWRIMHYRV